MHAQDKSFINFKMWIIILVLFSGAFFLLSIPKASAAITTAVTGIPGPSMTITSEVVGGSSAHILILTNPGSAPNYKWQFLTNGVRLFIDREDGFGYVQLISEIRTAPEFIRRQGQACIWDTYGLAVTTTGSNVLQGWDKQTQPDGSVRMVRTQDGSEKGTTETITSTWNIPASIEELATQGPKASYSMTQNRGIVTHGGCLEGTWRMKWELSGISEITSNNSNIVDSTGWPIRRKSYSNNEFTIDVNDFDNLFTTPQITFSEVASNNKAEIIFFSTGTTGSRVVDPTVVTTNIGVGWAGAAKRNVFYNGSYFFVLYSKTDGSIYYKSSADNSTWSDESTLVSDAGTNESYSFDMFLIDDSKFDFVYITDGANPDRAVASRTCTISDQTISCGTRAYDDPNNANLKGVSITRTPTGNRVYIVTRNNGTFQTYRAVQTGDLTSSTTWTEIGSSGPNGDTNVNVIPYADSDKILQVYHADNGGAQNDDTRWKTCTTSCTVEADIISGGQLVHHLHSGMIRISDTDFRLVIVDIGVNFAEWSFDGSSTWTNIATIETGSTWRQVSLFYDRISDDLYTFYQDPNGSNSGTIYREHKPSGSSWGSKTQVDNSESDANSVPTTQMHESPYGSSRTTPRELVWAYRNLNGTNIDVVVGNLNLAAGATAPTVTTDFASNIEATTARLNATKTGGDNATQHGFAWGTNSALSGGDTATTTLGALNSNDHFSSNISSLTPSITYFFRAYATNGGGTGFGFIRSFVTGNTTVTRKLRLFEGFSVKFIDGKIILHQN